MPVSAEGTFRFEDFVFNPRDASLRDQRGQIALRRKSFAVLCHLLENAGRLVTKDEIILEIWPGLAASDASLAQCVSEIRVALRDREQRIIRTVAGRGYIFAADLSQPAAATAMTFGEPTAPWLPQHAIPRPRVSPAMNNTSRPPPQAERRELTVLSCEWIGLNALAARIDPEDLRASVAACQSHCSELIEREGGWIAHILDDGVFAYFGYPLASAYDAERAVRVGLDLLNQVPRLRSTQLPQPRIGIASGIVVIGDEPAGRPFAVGLAPHLARRLQAKAEPGTLLIDPATRRLVRGRFTYHPMEVLALDGCPEPVEICRVLDHDLGASRRGLLQRDPSDEASSGHGGKRGVSSSNRRVASPGIEI
jgi:DNA-binding winged helix-turn-helix (wHTH) protein